MLKRCEWGQDDYSLEWRTCRKPPAAVERRTQGTSHNPTLFEAEESQVKSHVHSIRSGLACERRNGIAGNPRPRLRDCPAGKNADLAQALAAIQSEFPTRQRL